MPRRNKAQDLDFEIHVDQSCISEPMDHDEPTEMEKVKDLGVEQTQTESSTQPKAEPEVKPEADIELDNTKDEPEDNQDTPIPKDLEDDTQDKAAANDADATPLADENTQDAHHSESESEASDSRRESTGSGSSGSYVSHRRTSHRTEALIHAAARDIVDQIEMNRGRESMNSLSGSEDSFISHSQGGSARPSDAHSVAQSHGRESLQSQADGRESLHSHAESFGGERDSLDSRAESFGGERDSLDSHAAESVRGRESTHSGSGAEDSYVSHSRPGSARHSDAHSVAASHRESIYSGRQSTNSHRESLNSHRESIHSRAESTRSHQRESMHGAEDSYMSHPVSARQSNGHRSVAAESHHSTEDERSSSRNDIDDDVFSDHSPRSSMGSLSESDHRKMGKLAQMDASPRISDISQYDHEQEFVPTMRETPRPAFRSPSSVKAMQMSSPPASVMGSPRGRRGMSTISRLGSPSVSAQYSPKKTPPRFKRNTPPLVLLHVTLLPLRWGWGDVLDRATTDELGQDGKTLRDAWRQLQDRMGDTTVERGILLPHPQNDYEILEERLLEALELPMRRRARILECGHYLGPSNEMTLTDETDSEDEDYDDDDRRTSKRSLDQIHWCKTCRSDIRYDSLGPGKIFRVKVYASNGLMKAGAWEACWKEMERVDVELEPLVNPKAQEELNRLEIEQEREMELREQQYEDELNDLHEDEYSDHEDMEDELEDEDLERELDHDDNLEHHNEPLESHEEHDERHEEHGERHEEHDEHHEDLGAQLHEDLDEELEDLDKELHEDLHNDHLSEHSDAHEDHVEHLDEVHDREISFTEPTAETSATAEIPDSTPEFEEQLRREEERIREIYGHAPTQDDEHQYQAHAQYEERYQPSTEPMPNYTSREAHSPSAEAYTSHEAPKSNKNDSLPELLLESARVLMQDKRNLMIGVMSLLILVLAMRGGQTQSDPRTFQTLVVSPTITVTQLPAATGVQIVATAESQADIQVEETQVEESRVLEIEAEESWAQVEMEESQVLEIGAVESQVEETQIEDSQIAENQVAESQILEIGAVESHVEESQVEESQVAETEIVEREVIPDASVVEESPIQESVTPSECLSATESSSTPHDSHTTVPASSGSKDPCASYSPTHDGEPSSSQETEAPVQEPLRETKTVISERIVRIVETVTSVETATIRITETQLVSQATQPSDLFEAIPSSQLQAPDAFVEGSALEESILEEPAADEAIAEGPFPEESVLPTDVSVEESETLVADDESLESTDEAVTEPTVEAEELMEENLEVKDAEPIEEPSAGSNLDI
ncbi:hypothetical protein BGZ61DRAFT_449140 [Ilyonectria robusta]|uniref:uncharacterized protein n=1 Tax=Ilyonectria robusta TaxID=1079257 RepID=UPI001E8E03E4|nr:uncharacterized protein BGZ61DRAFT_449140 [Ilyonectria robusta]KAH8714501.1 hypothetical protein BGZ61DRAFT_449140 [Ilyonectria robusta]